MVLELDVNSAESRNHLVSEVERAWGTLDILVNNAGISYRAVVEHMSEEDEMVQMQTNYFGPMALIRRVLPGMRIKGRGKIINVSSVSGMLSMPTMASYSASKHALEGASEALWYEARPLGVTVSLIQPGFVNSQSFLKVNYTELSRPDRIGDAAYSDYYRYMVPFIEKMMRWSRTTSDDVARKIIKTIRTENPPLWISATPDATFFYYIRRLLPRRWLLPFLFLCLPKARTWGDGYSKRRN